MKRGKTEVETIKLNGWGPGDILEGQEGNKTDRILIVAMGDEKFVAKWDFRATGEYDRESGNFTLSRREWRKVGRIDEPPAWDGEGKVEAGMLAKCTRYANPVMVKFVGSRFSVVESDFGDECAMETHLLRPIRSEEDRAVEEMRSLLNDTFKAPNKKPSRIELCRAIYRAIRDGKVPGVKLAAADGEEV